MITRAQVRGARSMLGWTAERLAKAAHVHRRIIRKVELGQVDPQKETARRIMQALQSAGVEFPEGGVRLARQE